MRLANKRVIERIKKTSHDPKRDVIFMRIIRNSVMKGTMARHDLMKERAKYVLTTYLTNTSEKYNMFMKFQSFTRRVMKV